MERSGWIPGSLKRQHGQGLVMDWLGGKGVADSQVSGSRLKQKLKKPGLGEIRGCV